jgi:surfeit locus 1 family protein
MIADSKKHIREPPRVLSPTDTHSNAQTLENSKGRAVLIEGTFRHDKEVLLGLRSVPPNLVGAKAEGMAVNPLGYFIITPFVLKDGSTIFVNRGWVSMKMTNWDRPKGIVSLIVTPRDFEPKSTFSPVNDPKSKKLLWLEKSSLLAAADLSTNDDISNVVECIGELLSSSI